MRLPEKYLLIRKCTESETRQYRFETPRHVDASRSRRFQLLHNPTHHRPNRVTKQCTAALANRRQFHASPITHTRFIQFPNQKTVRQEDHIHMSCLTLISSQLTIAQPKFLLSVSVNGFRATPTTAISLHDPLRVPVNLIRYDNLSRFGVVLILPQDHDANLVTQIRHFHAHAQIPLLDTIHRHRLAIRRRNGVRKFYRRHLLSLERQLAVELQITDITTIRSVLVFQVVDVVLNFCTSIKTVEGESAFDTFFVTPVDQLNRKCRHLLELLAGPLALVRFFVTFKLQRIPPAADRIQVVDEDQVLGVLVSLFGMIPKRSGIFDELAALVDEHIVQADDTA